MSSAESSGRSWASSHLPETAALVAGYDYGLNDLTEGRVEPRGAVVPVAGFHP
jgi:hypothetical protein